jgi:DNA-binding FrmR family transcriptional regulator
LRLRRFKSVLIDLQQKQAFQGVILKMAPNRTYTPAGLAQAEALWLADPTHFAKHDIDPLSVPATAVVQIRKNLEALNKMLERAERRCDTIMQQLEYRREVFAHRARRAADTFLSAKTEQVQAFHRPI